MRINHRYDARARLSTVTATDLERRYAFADITTKLIDVEQVAASVLPDIGFEEFDNNRLIARFNLIAEIPSFAQLIFDVSGLFTERGRITLSGANVTGTYQTFSVTGPGIINVLLTDQSTNVHPDPDPGTVKVDYQLDGVRVYQQIETINGDVKFTRTLERVLSFPQPMSFTRNVTDFRDNP